MNTLLELLDELSSGRTTATAIAEDVIEAAGRHSDLNAFIAFDPEKLKEAARASDLLRASGLTGRLAGLPLAIKDNIDTTDLPTTGGTGALKGAALADAAVLARLKTEGAIVAAKANLHELAFGITSNNGVFGPVRNPHDLSRIAGGSSGGTAAAIAAGIVPAGLGTDTGGSVRIPAALCGIAGFRPSSGRYPAGGTVPLSSTRDVVGPMARAVADIALLDAVMAGERQDAPSELIAPSEVRLAVPRRVLWDNLEAGVEACCTASIERLARAGVTLIETDPADLWDDAAQSSFVIVLYETMRELPAYSAARAVELDALLAGIGSPDVRGIIESQIGENGIPEEAYRAAMDRYRPAMQQRWQKWFAEGDLHGAIFPTTPLVASPLGDDETVILNDERVPTFGTYIRNTDHGSIMGIPGISLPAGMAGGLPVGIEIDGFVGGDRNLLAVAATIEKILRD